MRTRFYTSPVALIVLTSCGGDPGGGGTTAPTVVSVGTSPAPTSTTGMTGGGAISVDCPSRGTGFATFDFQGGKTYPAMALVSLGAATYDSKSSMVHVPVTLDRPTPTTIILRTATVDGSALSGVDYAVSAPVVIFRPGDPDRQTISIPILRYRSGVEFALRVVDVQGAAMAADTGSIRSGSAATAAEPLDACRRPARTFEVTGRETYRLDRSTFAVSDQGSPTEWATSPAAGRERSVNEETGVYIDSRVAAFAGLAATHDWTDRGLSLRSEQFATPIVYNGTTYTKGAITLDARRIPAARVTYGQFEWVAQMPDRAGAWPALWLKTGNFWPPEIDVYEGFNYRSWWQADRYITSTVHGGEGGIGTFQQATATDAQTVFGLSGFSSGFHRYAIDLQPDYITWFVDGREVNQMVNPFGARAWYPVMSVAVRTPGKYTGGSGEMVVSSLRVFAQ